MYILYHHVVLCVRTGRGQTVVQRVGAGPRVRAWLDWRQRRDATVASHSRCDPPETQGTGVSPRPPPHSSPDAHQGLKGVHKQ